MPVLKPDHPRDPDFQAQLRALAPDCCPVVAYGAMLPQSALDIPPHGWVNLHFSLLPAWRGAAPVQHALWAGDEVTGATTFRIVEALDAGPTFGVMTEGIRPTDTAGDLLGRLAVGGASCWSRTLDGIESGDLEAREQPTEGVSLAPKILVEDAEVDWDGRPPRSTGGSGPARPAPGAWTTFEGERFKLGPVRHRGQRPGRLPPGVLEVDQERRARRDRRRSGPPRRGEAVRQEADGRGRLGPRRARRSPGALG